ncbi:MAG: type II 3-dehydroquinate dehydratase [Acidimicrobiales bacterium]
MTAAPFSGLGRPLVLLLSGPNLNLSGEREPEIYGSATLADHERIARTEAERHGLDLEHLQSNHEGELVDAIHGARGRCAAIVINAGAFTHYSWAIHDALATFDDDGPIVEVHLSNPDAREPWRRTSVVAPVATGSIVGFGATGYRLALDAVASVLAEGAP